MLTLDEFKDKMRKMEMYRHSKVITDRIMCGRDVTEEDNLIHRQMMESINDDKKMYGEYLKYISRN